MTSILWNKNCKFLVRFAFQILSIKSELVNLHCHRILINTIDMKRLILLILLLPFGGFAQELELDKLVSTLTKSTGEINSLMREEGWIVDAQIEIQDTLLITYKFQNVPGATEDICYVRRVKNSFIEFDFTPSRGFTKYHEILSDKKVYEFKGARLTPENGKTVRKYKKGNLNFGLIKKKIGYSISFSTTLD